MEAHQWGGATWLGLRWTDGTHLGWNQLCIKGTYLGLGALPRNSSGRLPWESMRPLLTCSSPSTPPHALISDRSHAVGIFSDPGETMCLLDDKRLLPPLGGPSQ